uniref:ZM domain-containing protein n=1 Tax=Globodera pallida TaxID=36090 RepID=A0A183BKK2_GLOPA
MSVRDVSQERMASQERETPFAGYGDRVGSGVAYTPTQWKGGELVTDPALVSKSIKPRRFYYSPIGDGVVAADGVELKRFPPDLTPKMEVIQQRIVDKSERGRPGVRITEKTWSTGGPTEDSLKGYGHTERPTGPPSSGAVRGSRAPETEAFANLSDQLGPSARPTSAQSAPQPSKNGFGGDAAAPKDWGKGPGDGAGVPKETGGAPSSRSTPLDFGKSPVSNGLGGGTSDFPLSGRSSAASTGLYEPGMRYEMRKDYRVTNPRELIHQYATTTPVTVIDPSLETTRTITRQHYTQTVEESFGPYPPYTSPPNVPCPLNFVRQLRDETMTDSQRQANRQQQPMSATSRDSNFEQRVEEIRRSTSRQASSDPMVEQLSNRLQSGLK